jgi:hypothetical protein
MLNSLLLNVLTLEMCDLLGTYEFHEGIICNISIAFGMDVLLFQNPFDCL